MVDRQQVTEDAKKAMRWFNQLPKEDKQKIALKAGGRAVDKITAYWRTIGGK
jgi:hypothetical protein